MLFNYSEIVKKNMFNRGGINNIGTESNLNLNYYGKEVTNAFHSVFMHSDEFKQFFEKHNSLIGYTGLVYTDHLIWDLDSADLNISLEDTITLVKRLSYFNSNNIRVFFSGSKGFHVIYYCKSEMESLFSLGEESLQTLPSIVYGVCSKIAKGLKTFDTKIYDRTRIIRTPNSIHPTTGLYKVELSMEQLHTYSIEDVREFATEQVISNNSEFDSCVSPSLEDVLLNSVKKQSTSTSVGKDLNSNYLLNGIQHGFEEGNRNSGLTSYAGLLHARNFDDLFITGALLGVNSLSKNPLSERDISNIVNSISNYPINEKYGDIEDGDIVTFKTASTQWCDLMTKFGRCSFGERYSHLNERMSMCIPGDVIEIVSDSGVGKTTIGMDIGNQEAKSRNMYSLMFSLEMSNAGLAFRAATMEYETNDMMVDTAKVAEKMLHDDVFRTKVEDEWKHMLIMEKGYLPIEDIPTYFAIAQEMTNNGVSNIVIDYAQNIDGVEDYFKAMKVARKMKPVAKKLQTKIILLLQCNKSVQTSYAEIENHHIEGVGAWRQACDYMIGVWRDEYEENRLHAKFMKERWGSGDVYFDLIRNGLKYRTVNTEGVI